MRLRSRLFATGVATVMPLSLGLFLVNERFRLRDMEDTLRRAAEAEIGRGLIERCEADPTEFVLASRRGRGAPPPPPDRGQPSRRGDGRSDGPYEWFLYRDDLTGLDGRGPLFPDALRPALASTDSASGSYATPEGKGVALALRVRGADSPCAVLLARMRPRPGTRRDEYASLALVLASVAGAVWLAAGPVIARMRRLAAAVRHSAATRYAVTVPVEGGDELADLARAFNAAGADVRRHLVDVQARREALQRFVADTTHDIALPLTVLQGHLADLDQTLAERHDDRARVRGAIEEAHYLSSLLRNLATAARLDEGAAPIDRRPVDLNALVERLVSRHRSVARARTVALDYAVPEARVRIESDLTLIEQAAGNLVDNAVQYSGPGGHVAIVLDVRAGGRFALTVANDGPAVTEADLSRITERRFRGSNARTRRPDGQGLGLGIVAEAVARLGLELAFRAPPEGGLVAEIGGPRLTDTDPAP
jgi:signal transduction histidine kinase